MLHNRPDAFADWMACKAFKQALVSLGLTLFAYVRVLSISVFVLVLGCT